MSGDDLERRLERLDPVAPRLDLRAEIVARLREETDEERGLLADLDRRLARPVPWAVAAGLLVLLGGVAWTLDRRHRIRPGTLPVTAATRKVREARRLAERIAAAIPDGPARDALRRRIRLRLTRAPTWPRSWSGGSS